MISNFGMQIAGCVEPIGDQTAYFFPGHSETLHQDRRALSESQMVAIILAVPHASSV
jgi:hypothetical protein